MPAVQTGLDVLLSAHSKRLRGRRVALVTHQASVDSKLRHAAPLLRDARGMKLVALWAPEHVVLFAQDRYTSRYPYNASGKMSPATTDADLLDPFEHSPQVLAVPRVEELRPAQSRRALAAREVITVTGRASLEIDLLAGFGLLRRVDTGPDRG